MSVIHDKIQVIARIRPPRKEEISLSAKVNFKSIVCKEKIYNFDNVYDCDSQQCSIFEQSVKPLLNNFLCGINTTIFAYGQTGAGKTYTMGTDQNNFHFQDINNWGIIPRFLYEMFNLNSSPNHKYEFAIQFLELYNEEIRDLLVSRNQHSNIRITDSKQGVILHGLSEKPVYSAIEALFYLNEGNKSRTTASTAMNSESSRSHSIFIFNLTQTKVNEETGVIEIIKSKFNFVDLAGSERLQRTKATGVRAKEGININFGLLVLGNVICALSENSSKTKRHVPYRDSKLTRLLEDSLGGNSKCMMIACVCPSLENIAETYNTLIYASRVANIENKISVNQKTILNDDNHCKHCLKLENRIKELENEIEYWKNQSNNCSMFENKVNEIIDNQKIVSKGNYERVMDNFTSFCHLVSLENDMKFLESIPNKLEDNNNLTADKQAYRQKIRSMKTYSFQGLLYINSERMSLNEFIDKLAIESKLNNLKIKNFINHNLEDQKKVNPVKFHEYRWNYLLNFVCKNLILRDCLQEELIRFYEDQLSKFNHIFRIYLQISYPTPDMIKDFLIKIQKLNMESDKKYVLRDNPLIIFNSLESALTRLFPIDIKPVLSVNFQSKTNKNSNESCDKEKTSSKACVTESDELKIIPIINKPVGTLNQNSNPLKRKKSMILNVNGKIEGKTFLKDNGLCLPIIPSPAKKLNLFPIQKNRSIFSSITNQNIYRPTQPFNIVTSFRQRNLLNLKK